MDIKKKINYNVKMIKNKKFNKINALLSGHCPDFKSLIYIGFIWPDFARPPRFF